MGGDGHEGHGVGANLDFLVWQQCAVLEIGSLDFGVVPVHDGAGKNACQNLRGDPQRSRGQACQRVQAIQQCHCDLREGRCDHSCGVGKIFLLLLAATEASKHANLVTKTKS